MFTRRLIGAAALLLAMLLPAHAQEATASSAAPTYLVGDVYPWSSNTVGSFGDNTLTNLDLVTILRAVTKVSVPPNCSDRYDAMDAYPMDTGTTRGGDGILTNLDMLVILRRVTSMDPSKPSRPAHSTCPGGNAAGNQGAVTAGARVPHLPQKAAGALEFGDAEYLSAESVRIPVWLVARKELSLAAFSYSVGTGDADQISLRFTSATATIVDQVSDGLIAAAWLDGIWVRPGQRVLLGYIQLDGSAGTVPGPEMLRVLGASAESRASGEPVLVVFPGSVLTERF